MCIDFGKNKALLFMNLNLHADHKKLGSRTALPFGESHGKWKKSGFALLMPGMAGWGIW